MIDIREALKRESERFHQEPDAFERLLRGRDRKQRNLRISAAAIALVIALLSLTALMHAFGNAPTPATRPTPIPVGTYRLAYEHDGDIYVADANGRNRVRIANGAPVGTPDLCGSYGGEGSLWSPDGRYLAFRGECPNTVSIADPTGRIVASFPVGMGWLISWSPDSTRVAVWAHGGFYNKRDRTIGIYGLDGVRQTLLTLPHGLMAPGDFDPVWSRDGQSLLVPVGVVVPIDGGAPRKLPRSDPRSHWDYTYSPDGTRVAYVSYVSNPSSLVVAAADGSSPRVLVHDASSPVWSPSGDRIAFNVWKMGETYALPTPEIRLVDVVSGTVTSVVTKGSGHDVNVLGFSPDGDRILFSKTDAAGMSSLWSVRADGSDPQLLVKGADWGEWQPARPTR